MSSRKKKKDTKRKLELVAPTPKPEQDPSNILAANARLANKALWRLETCALSLREAINFDPPDPAGPPNKFVVNHADGGDFDRISSIRTRALKFCEALDRYEDIARWFDDAAKRKEAVVESDIPMLRRTVTMSPDQPLPQKPADLVAVPQEPELTNQGPSTPPA